MHIVPKVLMRASSVGLILALSACDPANLVDVPSPSGVVDPSLVNTPAGAKQLYQTAVSDMAVVYGGGIADGGNVIRVTGIFTDELEQVALSSNNVVAGLDERNGSSPGAVGYGVYAPTYRIIQRARVSQQQARQALELYGGTLPKEWQAQMLVNEGFAIVWLAETFCSGVPLSYAPLVGSVQPTRGYTTTEMFEAAIALFDRAMTTAGDSTRFLNAAKVGKGRALLGLAKYADAKAAVQGVPLDFAYALAYAAVGGSGSQSLYMNGNALGTNPRIVQVVDNEGGTSTQWSADPRTAVTTSSSSGAMKVSAKYAITGSALNPNTAAPTTPIRLADGLEATLIEAEADLASGASTWLTTLNTLRTTCVGTAACAPFPGLSAMSALADPGTPAARVDLLMKERAAWLYLTGHREGDLRRLARQYGRSISALWPHGTYLNTGFAPNIPASFTSGSQYGGDVVLVPANDEKLYNKLYSGCYDTNP